MKEVNKTGKEKSGKRQMRLKKERNILRKALEEGVSEREIEIDNGKDKYFSSYWITEVDAFLKICCPL